MIQFLRCFIVFALLSFTTHLAYPQDAINNYTEPTPEHINIEGTNIYMIAPPFFLPSNDFKGFQDPTDMQSMIMVVEMPAPFAAMERGMTAEALAAQGMELTSKVNILVGKMPGMLLEANHPVSDVVFKKYILVYGSESKTVMINGGFLEENIELDERIRTSLMSTFVDETMEVDPRESIKYTVDESAGNLQFVGSQAGGLVFTRDGKQPPQSKERTVLAISQSYGKGAPITDQKNYAVKRMERLPYKFELDEEQGVKEVTIDELEGYEVHGKSTELENRSMCFTMLYTEDMTGYYVLIGQYTSGDTKALEDLQKVTRTFKRNEKK
jgi:hypothetical protein